MSKRIFTITKSVWFCAWSWSEVGGEFYTSHFYTSLLNINFSLSLSLCQPLSAMHGGGTARLRRDLRDALPYEAQMMSYPPAGFSGRGNDLYYQPEALRAQGLGHALHRLENDQRQEQEAAYLAGLLRLLSEAEKNGQARPEEEEEQVEGDFQESYPPDYDETEQTVNMAKPQALLDPQLTEALLNRYRQERMLQAGQDRDQEVLR